MGYITPEYYQDIYQGADAGDDLEKYIERASDIIDQATNYQIKDLQSLPEFIREQVMKAVAAQVEYFVLNSGDEAINAGMADVVNVGIGRFNYSVGHIQGKPTEPKEAQRISKAALAYLAPTGLLYQGLGVVGS